MATFHQFVPTLDPGAVGAHILEIQRTLRNAGWDSEVFSEHTKPPYDGLAHPFADYGRTVAAADDDVLMYHAAIGSSVADWLLSRRPRRLVVDHHNITPPEWFEAWEPGVAYGLAWGRAQLRRLARRARFGLADSPFNAAELERAGAPETAVLPILIPAASLGGAPDPAIVAASTRRPGARLVFVGRLAPNKQQHLLIATLAAFRRVYDPNAHLALVGGASSPAYEQALRRYVEDLGLAGAVNLTGPVSDAERNAYYATADAFVCVSAHEGFLVPVLEAWHHRVPVIAYAAAAVPGTVGTAGVLLPTTSPLTVAAAVARVCGDRALATALREAGTARLAEFALPRTEARLLELAEELVSGRADRPRLRSLTR